MGRCKDESEKEMKSGQKGGKISWDSSLDLSKSITERVCACLFGVK